MGFKTRIFILGFIFCLSSYILAGRGYAFDRMISRALSHYIMGGFFEGLGESDRALGEYKQALNSDDNSVIRLKLAVSYIKRNEFQRAIEELNTVVAIDPESAEPHVILTLLYSLQNNPEKASLEYEIALKNISKAYPKNTGLYKNLGILYLGQMKLPQALESFRMVLKLEPKDAEAHFYLANIFDQDNRRKQAQEELAIAIALKPDYHQALNYLGFLYAEEGIKLDSAEAYVKKALEFEPDNAAYIDSLGWVYFKQNKLVQAKKYLLRASQLLSDPIIFDHLGDLYFKSGDPENAKINWEKSLELDPGQAGVKEKIKSKWQNHN